MQTLQGQTALVTGGAKRIGRAIELAPAIRVNGIAPGPILPPPGADDGIMHKLAAQVPFQATGHSDDIAAAVCFLAQSPFITGQTIYVDGGAHLAHS